jgi:aminoglycoside phosphotransferase
MSLENMPSAEKHTTLDAINAALKEHLDLEVRDVQSLDPKDLGDNAEVFTGQLADRKVFIKLESNAKALAIEKAIFDLLNKYGIPCPKALGFIPNVPHFNKALLIDTAVEGIQLSRLEPSESNLEACEAAGKTIKKLHEIKVDGFGSLQFKNNELIGSMESLAGKCGSI